MATVSDLFGRTVSNGWGTADTGQVWTVLGTASDYSVGSTVASQSNGSVNSARTAILDTGETDGTVAADIRLPVVPTGASATGWVLARYSDSSNHYIAQLVVTTTGSVNLQVLKRVAGSLSSIQSVSAIGTHAANNWWRVVFDVRHDVLRARAWNLHTQWDPGSWQITATDSDLTTGTFAGVQSRLESGNTNTLPVVFNFDQFEFTPVITAVEQDVYPPRILVTVQGLTVGDSVAVYRSVAGEWSLLRGGSSDSVTDTSFLVIDAELPFGIGVAYRVIVNGDNDWWGTSFTTYTLSGGLPVITDAISGLSAEAKILAWPEKQYVRRHSRFQVGGRNVVVSDAGSGQQFTGTIEFFTEATSSRDNLMTVLTDATGGVVQIRQPGGGYDGVDCYATVTGITERRHSQDGSDPRRIIAVDVTEVESWAASLEARGYTYADLEAAYTGLTYADLDADFDTYLDLAQAEFSS